jgi:hypothetical protein
MADLRFLASCIVPKRTRILGKTLKPFCLKYRLWLSAIGSPFLEQDKEIQISDLIIALKVCSGESLDRAKWSDYWTALKLSLFKDTRVNAFKSFITYSMTNDSWPKFYDNSKNSSGSSTGLPWELSVIANLTRNGISYEEALNMPEASAIWLSTAFSMHAGARLELLTTDDEALIDHLAKLRDEELKKTDTK